MKAQEIKVGHIYYVEFEPVRKSEFGGRHLCVVVKKNHDKISFVVVPMTSQDSGLGVNKISLGKLSCLPANLRNADSYAVIDQIRTLDATRFYKLHENGSVVDAVLPKEKMIEIYKNIIRDLLHDVDPEDILKIFC